MDFDINLICLGSELLFSHVKQSLKHFSSILISLQDISIESMFLRLLKQLLLIEIVDSELIEMLYTK